jgi:hypothetical protein
MMLSQFQRLSWDNEKAKENRVSISSLKDAQKVVESGLSIGWGQVVTLSGNNHHEGLGFSPSSAKANGSSVAIKTIEETFHSVGFIYSPSSEVNVIPEDDSSTPAVYPSPQQAPPPVRKQNRSQRKPHFDSISMPYADLLPALIWKNLVQTRAPPPVPAPLPRWFKSDHFCAFHQGAPGHDIEDCWALKYEVQRLTRTNVLCFKD